MQNVRNMRSNSNTVFINKMWFKFASNSLDVVRYIFDAKRSFPLSTLCRQRERERERERERMCFSLIQHLGLALPSRLHRVTQKYNY